MTLKKSWAMSLIVCCLHAPGLAYASQEQMHEKPVPTPQRLIPALNDDVGILILRALPPLELGCMPRPDRDKRTWVEERCKYFKWLVSCRLVSRGWERTITPILAKSSCKLEPPYPSEKDAESCLKAVNQTRWPRLDLNNFCDSEEWIRKLKFSDNHPDELGAYRHLKDLSFGHFINRNKLDLTSININILPLDRLYMTCTPLADEGITYLAQHPTLKTLSLNWCKFGDDGAKALGMNTTLTVVKLVHSSLSDTACASLAQNSHWSTLDLTENDVGTETLKALSQNKALKTFIARGGAVSLDNAAALALNTTLTYLDCAHNLRIQDSAYATLAKMTGLRTLILRYCALRDAGAQEIAKSASLTELDLGANRITGAGAKALAQNTSLKCLDLDHNPVNDEGGNSFLENTTLTKLCLLSTHISQDTREKLKAHMVLPRKFEG